MDEFVVLGLNVGSYFMQSYKDQLRIYMFKYVSIST